MTYEIVIDGKPHRLELTQDTQSVVLPKADVKDDGSDVLAGEQIQGGFLVQSVAAVIVQPLKVADEAFTKVLVIVDNEQVFSRLCKHWVHTMCSESV